MIIIFFLSTNKFPQDIQSSIKSQLNLDIQKGYENLTNKIDGSYDKDGNFIESSTFVFDASTSISMDTLLKSSMKSFGNSISQGVINGISVCWVCIPNALWDNSLIAKIGAILKA